jgi:hypothetical protein
MLQFYVCEQTCEAHRNERGVAMIQQTPMVNVGMPIPLYNRLKRAAELTHRSVEDVLAATVNVALVTDASLPADLANELAAMMLFSDDALWSAAESSMSPAQQRRLEQLPAIADSRGLTAAEAAELDHLMEVYDRSVLRRAKALAILAQRGYQLPNQSVATQPPSRCFGAQGMGGGRQASAR